MEQILTDTTLHAATQMAAAGQYAAAAALLDALEPSARPLEATLLQAKMLAQQGRYADAIAHWQRVLTVIPDHREAQQGLRVAQQLRARGNTSVFRRANLYYGVGALASLLLLLGLAYIVGYNAGHTRQQQRDATVLGQHITQLTAHLQAQQQALLGSQQYSSQAMAQITQQQDTFHTRTLDQFATLVRALEEVQQRIPQTQAQITAALTTLQQRLDVLSNTIETAQHAQHVDTQSQAVAATHLQESLAALTTLVHEQQKQLRTQLETPHQACQDQQP